MNAESATIRDSAARDRNRTVALESTLIAHGLPWPSNAETARASEEAVREAGAIPATIAVIGGAIRIGIDSAELDRLAKPRGLDDDAGVAGVLKAGRRDLAAAVAQKRDAATTVSSTLFLARSHGIRIMATGGLGGVHRDWTERLDISADLDELARADGALVVCSGFKHILDLSATMERLETLGVAVIGYRTDILPGFTVRSAGIPLETIVDDSEQAASLVRTHRALGLPGAIVLVQPVPDAAALDPDAAQAALDKALASAKRERIRGKELTPYLLERTRSGDGGLALRANQALIVANAGLAGAVAARLAS